MPAFFKTMDKAKPVYDIAYKVVLFICKIFLIGDVLITSMAVLGRYVSFIPDPAWTEEIVLTLMAYIAVLSAALAVRRGAHIRMTAFDRYFSHKVIRISDLFCDICVLAFGIFMFTVGIKYANAIGAKGFYTSIPTLSKFWMYFPVPLAGIAMIVFETEAIYSHIRSFFVPEEKEDK